MRISTMSARYRVRVAGRIASAAASSASTCRPRHRRPLRPRPARSGLGAQGRVRARPSATPRPGGRPAGRPRGGRPRCGVAGRVGTRRRQVLGGQQGKDAFPGRLHLVRRPSQAQTSSGSSHSRPSSGVEPGGADEELGRLGQGPDHRASAAAAAQAAPPRVAAGQAQVVGDLGAARSVEGGRDPVVQRRGVGRSA